MYQTEWLCLIIQNEMINKDPPKFAESMILWLTMGANIKRGLVNSPRNVEREYLGRQIKGEFS